MLRYFISFFDKKEFIHVCKINFLIISSVVFVAIVLLVLGSTIFGVHRVNIWLSRSVIWRYKSTKISYMQSMFQLGAATSIAFAVAGLQIQHALGPRIIGAIQSAKLAMSKPNAPVATLKSLISSLQNYNRYKRTLVGYTRSYLYRAHIFIAFCNIILLVWSSLIDPRGEIQSQWAFFVVVFTIMFPLTDLVDTFIEAHHIRPILQEAKNACSSDVIERIEAVCCAINAEIKPFPTNI